jgi:hypothetical protein
VSQPLAGNHSNTSLPAWLLTRTPGGNQANLVCMVAPFAFNQGKATTSGFVMETDDVQVVGVGFIDFRQSEVNLQFKPKALRQQFIKIAQPFAISGPARPSAAAADRQSRGRRRGRGAGLPVQPARHDSSAGKRRAGARAPCRVIQTARNAGGLLSLPLVGRQPPLFKGSLLGPSSPLSAPLGILKQPLFGGPSR